MMCLRFSEGSSSSSTQQQQQQQIDISKEGGNISVKEGNSGKGSQENEPFRDVLEVASFVRKEGGGKEGKEGKDWKEQQQQQHRTQQQQSNERNGPYLQQQ